MATLEVWLNDILVGSLTSTRRGARFAYEESLVESLSGKPLLSTSLPVKARPYAEGLTGNWFRGVLPEGDRLDFVCRHLGCRSDDYVTILRSIGWECAGAVRIIPSGFQDPGSDEPAPLTTEELASRLREARGFSGPAGPLPRLSLGGYQEKLCLTGASCEFAGGMAINTGFILPSLGSVSTHLLKPQPRNSYPNLIEGEAWAMEVARHATSCAKTGLLHLEGAPLTLVVERFDRKRENGQVKRIHQEDCCQALGIDPSHKYADYRMAKGDDPSYSGIASLLARYSTDPMEQMTTLLRQVTVNLALGNNDAHAKNFSFLYARTCTPTLSPMYDVAPVVDIDHRIAQLSMRVNGKIDASEVRMDDLVAEALSWGLPDPLSRQVIQGTLDDIRRGIEAASELYPAAGARHAQKTLRRIESLAR